MTDIPRGTIFGRRVGDQPKSDAEHFIRCPACGGWIDCRDLACVFEHEGPLPHPAPIATQALVRIAALYAIKADIRGLSADELRQARQRRTKPLLAICVFGSRPSLPPSPAKRPSPEQSVLGQIADIPQGQLAELLPWNWKQPNLRAAA